MRIFGKRKVVEEPELTLVQVQESEKYDFFAALAKALLLFLLVYGALGGFLSALEMEYNNGLCMLMLFVLALFLSAVYETGKRWLTNLVSLLLFAAYLYVAVSNYWIINSGYYAILNRLFELARQYLDVQNGTEYSLMVEETYLTITVFAMFLGMVGIILLNIMLQGRCSLRKVVLLTLSPYVFLFYLECSPDLIYMIFLFIGYLTVAILQGGNVREKMARQMRYTLPLAAVLAVLFVRVTALLMPEADYGSLMPKNAFKESSEEHMARFAQFGLMALFNRGANGSGVSGGVLSKGAAVMPSYETDLIVRYTPYSFQPIYLKAFTGKNYLGTRWSEAGIGQSDNALMAGSVAYRRAAYEAEQGSQFQGQGVMEIEYVRASREYEYRPYYTDPAFTEKNAQVTTYTYYPYYSTFAINLYMSSRGMHVEDEWDEGYLEVPQSCRNAVEKVCAEAGFTGTAEDISEQIVAYFQDNYSYTLRPGYYLGNPDYITHFLLENKKGYCTHFASSATMLFREMGIPARYVEGYAFSYLNVVQDGTLVEDAEYSDYYNGYAPIGETALVEMEIPDAYAHAWVEIYVEGKGWLVVDPTPAQTSQEDTTSFWDAFMNGNVNDSNLEMAESNLGAYLENALGGISYALLGAAVLFLIGFCILMLVRAHREKMLPGRERVKLEYGRICSCLNKKYGDYRKLRTLREQIDWIRDYGQMNISKEQETDLYQVFFAERADCDCDQLYTQLRKIRNSLQLGGIKRKNKL